MMLPNRAALLLITMLLIAPSAQGGEPSAESIKSFADHLYGAGDYYRAITEYERLLFFYPTHTLSTAAQYQIAMAYLEGGKYTQAIKQLRDLSNTYAGSEIGRKAQLSLAEAYIRKKDHHLALNMLEEFLASYPRDPRADAVRIRTGWVYLQLGEWQQAGAEFRSVPAGSAERRQAEALAGESAGYPGLQKKSPALAGTLSAVLPGAGQLYVGRPADATTSFLLNSLFIWATVEAFKSDNDVTGGILLFFESGWYFGNIYNAMGSAHKYNRRAEQRYLDDLQSRYGISYLRDDRGRDILAFTLRF
ncbi:MAG: hypothetical protein A2X56_10480 [Nitrospirae bacterium GWC2_57_13]|jgi:tetratricopeptide (TPR) repeat protein|nr:MAG: hypothetical protein A2X56_10480 [Nitrospirae bacterium GWC2_57_13]OGW46828.1 MAG: hypothetical protein A2X57_11225 [Nitrospirae bacterium GWD2_57_8]